MTDALALKVATIHETLAKDRGAFRLFALFSRGDVPGMWDLLASAPWGDKDSNKALRILVDTLQGALPEVEFRKIARTIWFDPKDPGLKTVLETIGAAILLTGGAMEIQSSVFNGLVVDRAVLFACNREI